MVAVGLLVAFAMVAPKPEGDEASLGGRITDEAGAAVMAATVSARNAFSREVFVTKTDRTGFYKFDSLRPGRYSMFASAEGHHCRWVLNGFYLRGNTPPWIFAHALFLR